MDSKNIEIAFVLFYKYHEPTTFVSIQIKFFYRQSDNYIKFINVSI